MGPASAPQTVGFYQDTPVRENVHVNLMRLPAMAPPSSAQGIDPPPRAGQKIAKDGVGFSLIGAGGIQFNISKNLGLFLDPTFSWNIPSDNRKLDTYRSEHPFMFTVSTGLRVTIPTRK